MKLDFMRAQLDAPTDVNHKVGALIISKVMTLSMASGQLIYLSLMAIAFALGIICQFLSQRNQNEEQYEGLSQQSFMQL